VSQTGKDTPTSLLRQTDGPLTRELAQVPRDVSCATWVICFCRDVHHRHWSLRRNARYSAPDEFIEHQIADRQHPFAGKPAN